jgi:hypothetical protein
MKLGGHMEICHRRASVGLPTSSGLGRKTRVLDRATVQAYPAEDKGSLNALHIERTSRLN